MFMKIKILTLFIVVLSIFALRISPGAFTATGIPTGTEKDFGIDLTVYNQTDAQAKYIINVIPGERIRDISIEGYEPMPDPSFIFFREGDTITVPPNDKKGHRIISLFPDSLKNRHFIAQVSVEPLESGMFNTIILPTYFLETEPDESTIPKGLHFVPSVVDMSTKGPVLHNNTDQPMEVSLELRVADPSKKGLNYDNTPDYAWLKGDEVQIEGETTFTMDPGSSRAIEISHPERLTGEIMIFANKSFARMLFPPPPPLPTKPTE